MTGEGFTTSELALLERIVADRVHKEKAKQRWGRAPKKYADLQQKLAAMLRTAERS